MKKRWKETWPLCNKSSPGPKTTGRAAEIKRRGKRHKNFTNFFRQHKNKAEHFSDRTKVIGRREKASAERSGKTRPSEVYRTNRLHALHWVARLQKSPTVPKPKKNTSLLFPKHACVLCWAFFLFLCCLSVGRLFEGDAWGENSKIYSRKI